MTTVGEYDKQYRYCHSGVTALLVVSHQRPGEFGRSSLLCGARPSGVGFVQLADLAFVRLNLEEQARRFTKTPYPDGRLVVFSITR